MSIVFVSRRAHVVSGLIVLACATCTSGVFAQGSDWQPFKERDARAARDRSRAPPLPPPLPTIERGDLNRPYSAVEPPSQSSSGRPSFGSPTVETGTPKMERIELPPIGDAPTAPFDTPSTTASGLPQATAGPSTRGHAIGQASGPASVNEAIGQRSVASRPLPPDVWRGVDMRQLESLVGPLDVPPKSASMHGLWTRLLTTDASPPGGGQGPSHYLALQLEALYRSGLTGAMAERLKRSATTADDPLITAFSIRLALVDADSAKACDGTRRLAAKRGALPKLLLGEVHVLSGYCAAVQGNVRGAGLAAELAREDEVEAAFALQVMDAVSIANTAGKTAAGTQKAVPLAYPKRLTVLEYRLLELLGGVDARAVLESAEPALLNAIANADNVDPRLTLSAAEAAAASHALAPDGLAEVYGAVKLPADAVNDPFFRRATLFKALVGETDSTRKLQLARQLIDDARRSGFGLVMARTLAAPLADVRSAGTPGALSVVAVETALAAGDHARARQLASGQPEAQAWLVLVDIADPRTQGVSDGALAAVDGLARQGRFDPVALHRLATVLDALDVNVPVPLWEAANRTPQPTTGYLPETGTLPLLQEAVRRGEIGRTALLVMRTIGSDGPTKAHLVGLGDAIRALRRVGLEADARMLALEALYADWPRGR